MAENCSCVFSSTSRKDEVDENAQANKRKNTNTGENADV